MANSNLLRLATTLGIGMKHRGHEGSLTRPISFTHPPSHTTPLVVLLDNIFFLPVTWRKFIIDACRIQAPVRSNRHLEQRANVVTPTALCFSVVPNQNTVLDWHVHNLFPWSISRCRSIGHGIYCVIWWIIVLLSIYVRSWCLLRWWVQQDETYSCK